MIDTDVKAEAMELLRHLRQTRRCEVYANWGKLYTVPRSNLTPEDCEAVTRLKPAIIAALAEQHEMLKLIEKTDWTGAKPTSEDQG